MQKYRIYPHISQRHKKENKLSHPNFNTILTQRETATIHTHNPYTGYIMLHLQYGICSLLPPIPRMFFRAGVPVRSMCWKLYGCRAGPGIMEKSSAGAIKMPELQKRALLVRTAADCLICSAMGKVLRLQKIYPDIPSRG